MALPPQMTSVLLMFCLSSFRKWPKLRAEPTESADNQPIPRAKSLGSQVRARRGARKSRGSKSGGSDLAFWCDFGQSCDPQIGPKSSQTQGSNT